MSNKIAVTKSGYNALTDTNPNHFIFHSDYNTFKILAEGTHSPTLSDSGGVEAVTSVAHGKSFIPFVFAFCKFTNDRSGSVGNRASNANFWFTRVILDSTNINFYYINSTGGNYTPVFKYYITEVPL